MSTTTSSRASPATSGRSTRSPSRRTADPTRAAARTATCASPTSRRTTSTPSRRRPPRPLAGHGRRRSRYKIELYDLLRGSVGFGSSCLAQRLRLCLLVPPESMYSIS
eukprot:scaffold57888_cov57-Phaeocystis_antarctica.AAC.1